jgi:predicted dehydrogenase
MEDGARLPRQHCCVAVPARCSRQRLGPASCSARAGCSRLAEHAEVLKLGHHRQVDLLPDIGHLELPGHEPELAVPAVFTQKWPSLAGLARAPAYNVGRAYAAFAADIETGTHTVPDFADAVRRHELMADIERSAASGERVQE